MTPDPLAIVRTLSTINSQLWDVLAVTLVLAGLLFTVSSRFVQLRYLGRMFVIFAKAVGRKDGGVSSFQALVLSIAGCVGIGNIAGVAIAVATGGPGSVFWMWVAALLGMATSYFECSLAQLYKVRGPEKNIFQGGPGFYMLFGLKSKLMSLVYSSLLLVTYGFSFTALQANVVSRSFQNSFSVDPSVVGAGLTLLLMVVIFGGIRRITRTAERLVPLMALGYISICSVVIGVNVDKIPGLLALIFKSAFGFGPVAGATIGSVVSIGIRRGLFTNEAGLGGAPNVAAISHVSHPSEQGIVQSLGVFFNTIVLCTCTALVILVTDVSAHGQVQDGSILAQVAFSKELGQWGCYFVSMAIFLFAFTTIFYNAYLGENALTFMKAGCVGKRLMTLYRLAICMIVFVGCVANLRAVLTIADIAMGLLSLINLAAVVLLLRDGLILLKDYDRQHRKRLKPVFSAPDDLLPNLPQDSPWRQLDKFER